MNRILPGGETASELATSSKFNIGIDSITIGQSSGLGLNGINNVFLGNKAGFNAENISETIFIGMTAGDNIVYGNRNIIIGDETSINYNKYDTISLGYNNSINNYSIGTGLDIVSIGNSNILYGYNINSYGTNSISYGNYINTTNSIIFIDNLNTDNNNIDNIIVKNITGNTDIIDNNTCNILYKRYDFDNKQPLNIIDYNSDIILKFKITSNINFKFSLGFYKDDIEKNIFTIDNTKLYYNNIEYNIQQALLYEYDNILHIINNDYITLSLAIHINPEYDELLNINKSLFTKNILNNNINSKTINNIRILYDLDNINNTSNIFYNSNISNTSNNIINTNNTNNINNTGNIFYNSNTSNTSNTSITSNLIMFDNYKFNNINSGISFDNFIISINNLDDNNYNNLAYGKNISIKGTKNICIGNKINTLGYNSILIGDNISCYDSNIYNYNNVQNSIIIGNNNLKNNYSKNSLIIGNDNFNNIIDDIFKYENFLKKNPIIIGSNLNNIDYILNIDDTILKYDDNIKEKQVILSGLNSYNEKTLPVAIGYSNISELNIIDDNYKLYVKDGIYVDKIYSSNYYGNGENLTNINISDITTTSLKEGSNLYFTRERVEEVISSSSIWAINDDNIQYCNIKIYNSNIDTEYITSSSNSLGLRTKFDLTTNQIELNLNGFNYQQNNSSSWSISSDERIKCNIEEANYNICYDNIKNLPLKRFKYKEGIDCLLSKDKTKLGFIAQDIKIKYPKNVEYKPIKINNEYINDCLSIDLEQINMTLYGSVKKLIELNDNKENRIKLLEDNIKELNNRIELLEKI